MWYHVRQPPPGLLQLLIFIVFPIQQFFQSWYLSTFSCSFTTMIFWRPDMAMPMIKQLFAILPVHKISIQVCSITLSVWIGKFHKILHPSFSSTESGTCSYQLSSHSRWGFLGSSQWIFFATLSCLFPTLSWWY